MAIIFPLASYFKSAIYSLYFSLRQLLPNQKINLIMQKNHVFLKLIVMTVIKYMLDKPEDPINSSKPIDIIKEYLKDLLILNKLDLEKNRRTESRNGESVSIRQ